MTRAIVSMEDRYLEQVLAIEKASSRDPWPESAFLAELGNPWSFFKVVGTPGAGDSLVRVEGYVVCRILYNELHLLRLAVEPDCRRQGLGGLLLGYALDGFSRCGGGLVSLEVRRSNGAAKGLYRAFGFRNAGVRPGYYRRDNEDALIMTRLVEPVMKTGRKNLG